jgi:hypothetical protein
LIKQDTTDDDNPSSKGIGHFKNYFFYFFFVLERRVRNIEYCFAAFCFPRSPGGLFGDVVRCDRAYPLALGLFQLSEGKQARRA